MAYEVIRDNDRVGSWIAAQADWDWAPGMGEAIGLEKDGQLIGGFAFTNFRGSGMETHAACVEGSGWMLNRHFLRAVRDLVYGSGCIRLTAPVPESEQGIAQMLLRAGFKLEAVLPLAHFGQSLWLFVLWLDKPNLLTRLEVHGRRRQQSPGT